MIILKEQPEKNNIEVSTRLCAIDDTHQKYLDVKTISVH